jgi:hypothetical protein
VSEEREENKWGGGDFEAHKLQSDKVDDEPSEIERVGTDRADSDGPSDDDFEGHKLTTDKYTDI